jgi:hypothetical protein
MNYFKNNPVIYSNILLLSFLLLIGYRIFDGQVIGYNDALTFYDPNIAENFMEYVINGTLHWWGTIFGAIHYGFFQAIARNLEITDPRHYPWFIPITLDHFYLFASSMNLGIYFNRVFTLRKINKIVMWLILVVLYSFNDVFLKYALNPGFGSYSLIIYILSILLILISDSRFNFTLIYITYSVILLGSNMTPIFAYLIISYFIYEKHLSKQITTIMFKRHIIAFTSLIVMWPIYMLNIPQNKTRLAQIGYGGEFWDNLGEHIIILLERVVFSTYRNMSIFDDVNHNYVHYLLMLLVLYAVVKLRAKIIKAKEDKAELGEYLEDVRIMAMLILGVLGLYSSQVRTLVSSYYGEYSDSNPSFFLIFIIAMVYVYLIKTIQSPKVTLLLSTLIILYLSTQSIVIQAQDMRYNYLTSIKNSSYLSDIYDNLIDMTQNEGVTKVTVKGFPMSYYFSGGNVKKMMKWKNNKLKLDVYYDGFPGTKETKHSVNVNNYILNPDKLLQIDSIKPIHIGSKVFIDHISMDYYLPEKICDITIEQNPNLMGSPMYKNIYLYKLTFSNGGWGGPIKIAYLSLNHSNETPIPNNYNISIEQPHSNRQVVRFNIYGGNKNYIYTSNKVNIKCG